MLKLIFTGNLGKEPEMRYTPAGKPVTNLSVASSRKYKTGDGTLVEETTWLRVAVWGNMAEACNQYLHKGSKVCVEGRLVADDKGNPRTFQRTDGTTGASFEVNAETVEFLDSKSSGNGSSTPASGDEGVEIPF